MSEDHVGIRIDPESRKKIEDKVAAKEYKNISAFVNEAINEKLEPDYEDDRFVQKLDKALDNPKIAGKIKEKTKN